jgi:stage V sporulation protein G
MEHRTTFDALVVTNVQCYPISKPTNKVKAYARVIINSQLQLTGIRVIESPDGNLFIGFPLDPAHSEDYQSVYYPITQELRDHIEEVVLEKFFAVQSAQETHGNTEEEVQDDL